MLRSPFIRVLSWILSALAVAFVVIRLAGWDRGFVLVALVGFVPAAALCLLLLGGGQALARHWWQAAVSGLCGLALVAVWVPRGMEGSPASEGDLTVLSVNLLVGAADVEKVVEYVEEREVDVMAVQELTPHAEDRFGELGLDAVMPHSIRETGWDASGSALYSRHPLERLEGAEPDGIFHQFAARVSVPGEGAFNFMAVHTAAPRFTWRVPLWEEDMDSFPEPGGDPWILAGDFNSTLDHSALRRVLDQGYDDAASVTGGAMAATWRMEGYLGGWLRAPGMTLDHVLVSRDTVAVADYEVLDDIGSDHRPILVEAAVF
ncbi:endonuclease/exonuclease/phosphatase family protein [Salininema proteolyticum]|uniref:Endonuclease/exonuclease/phosphatase family protein n=1 Tax=Salininema proteolyticum TaxID=1607685 RepID=A0ABV8TUS9_9ACTN